MNVRRKARGLNQAELLYCRVEIFGQSQKVSMKSGAESQSGTIHFKTIYRRYILIINLIRSTRTYGIKNVIKDQSFKPVLFITVIMIRLMMVTC